MYNTPILFIIFNRLDTVKIVFNRIKELKPKILYLASDGPRPDKLAEMEQVQQVRNYVISQVDWDCELHTLFQNTNLGCGIGPYTAITWFFNHVDRGIILEDDCLPEPQFFNFCADILDRYKDNERIYEISGTNLQGKNNIGDASYYFSRYGGIWGWATWARAWKQYDHKMSEFPKFNNENKLDRIFRNNTQKQFWIKTLSRIYELTSTNKLDDVWDYQWLFTIWNNDGICIVPNHNFITNIGFSENATHTIGKPAWYSELTSNDTVLTSIVHPNEISISEKADNFQFERTIHTSKFSSRFRNFIKRFF